MGSIRRKYFPRGWQTRRGALVNVINYSSRRNANKCARTGPIIARKARRSGCDRITGICLYIWREDKVIQVLDRIRTHQRSASRKIKIAALVIRETPTQARSFAKRLRNGRGFPLSRGTSAHFRCSVSDSHFVSRHAVAHPSRETLARARL